MSKNDKSKDDNFLWSCFLVELYSLTIQFQFLGLKINDYFVSEFVNEIWSKIFLKFYETKWRTFLNINFSEKFTY